MLTVPAALQSSSVTSPWPGQSRVANEHNNAQLGWGYAKANRSPTPRSSWRRANGEALVDIARTYNVSHSTISRLDAGMF